MEWPRPPLRRRRCPRPHSRIRARAPGRQRRSRTADIDADELLAIWDELFLPANVETAWADYFERVQGVKVRRRWNSSATADVDLRYNEWHPVATAVGPARCREELAVDNLVALFGRALPRDFVDVFLHAQRHEIDNLLRWAPEKDPSFSPVLLAEGLETMLRHRRHEFDD